MGDLVLGRLLRAVERGLHQPTLAQGESRLPIPSRQWAPIDQLTRLLEGVEPDVAERIGGDLIDRDVRDGPYRFLRPELDLETLDVVAAAVFRNYLLVPGLEVRVRPGSVQFSWDQRSPRGAALLALLDGMAKRLTELAQLTITSWGAEERDHVRTLSGELGGSP